MTAAVEASDLFRIYPSSEGASVALKGLTLDVREGEIVVIFGPSGSGKSTLLRILAGLDHPSAGSIRVFGEDLRKIRGRRLIDYRSSTLGYADQHYNRVLAPELPARAQVSFHLGLFGVSKRERGRVADRLLERVGLLDRRDAKPTELSGGQQQRVAICAALAHRPRLFIADEPTGELDAATARQIYALIRDLSHQVGATTILVSHDPESAAVADRVVQIRDGRVSAELLPPLARAKAVINKGGWIRVPEELLPGAALGGRVQFERNERGVLLVPDTGVALATDRDRHRGRRNRSSRPGSVIAEAEQLTKRYGRGAQTRDVFRELSAAFCAGQLAAVTGPSGSGKSTLLHLLAGLDLPTEGEVRVLDQPVNRLDRAARARLRRSSIALVTQGTDLVSFLTAQETVELALAMRNAEPDGIGRRAAEALAAVGLAELAGQRVARLSMGERQRVALARALVTKPKLLLADEPTARLDEANARIIATLFETLARSSRAAIVCATHDPVLIEHADAQIPLGAAADGAAA